MATETTEIEHYAKYHSDVSISNNNKTATNWHNYTYNRTCYGKIEVPSTNHCIASWTISITQFPSLFSSICVGIDCIQQMDTWFYANKESPNYGYDSQGKIYGFGKILSTKSTAYYRFGDKITIILNTASGTLQFFKKRHNDSQFWPQHSCKVAIDSDVKYRLAVCLKDASVTIDTFTLNVASKETHNEINDDNDIETEAKYDGSLRKQQIVNAQIDITGFMHYLQSEINKFKENCNETVLTKICEENPMDLINENSSINSTIKLYEDNVVNIMNSLNLFTQYIKNTKSMIKKLSSPKKSQYKQWNINTMIIWIGSLENGRYVKYLDVLKTGFLKSEILTAEYLPDLDIATLSVQPFNITSFPDKRDLIKQFNKLNIEHEGNQDDTVYH